MFFDCECMVGRPKKPLDGVAQGIVPDVADLAAEMRRLGIARTLVRHRACVEATPESGNGLLLEEIRGQENLVPAWHLTPDGTQGQWDPVAAVEEMLAHGARAAWTLTQGRDAAPFLLDPWCAGEMLGALQRHRVPLLLSYPDAPLTTLHQVLEAFPGLPVILLEAPRNGRSQPLYRLMTLHGNLHLCVSPVYSVHEGIEDLCRCFGAHRLVFGSGYPHCEGGASVAMLTYARISDAGREAIAGGNLRRLLDEVKP